MRTKLKQNIHVCVVFKKMFKLYNVPMTEFLLERNFLFKFLLPILRLQGFFADNFASKDFLLSTHFDYFETTCEPAFAQKFCLDVFGSALMVLNNLAVTFLDLNFCYLWDFLSFLTY